MPDRIKARFAVTVLLILLTTAGLSTIGPAASLGRPASHVVAGCLLLEVVLAGLLFALRWQHRPPGHELAGQLHRILSIALTACMIAVLVVLAFYGRHQNPPAHLRPRAGRAESGQIVPAGTGHWPWLRYLLFALLLIAVIAVVILAWQRGSGWRYGRRRRRLTAGAGAGAVEDADDLARAVESGRIALRELDDARAAIIACYVAMELSLGEAGAARGAAETPDELLARALAGGLVSPGPAARLTGLFYEARYSTHPMAAAARDQAERALADIATSLPAGEPA